MSNGNGDKAANGTGQRGTTGLSSDAKWMMGVSVAAIISIGIAAVAVSVTVFQLSRIAADMRNHEHRTDTSNNEAILALQTLVHGMRDEYRDRMRSVEAVLRELQAVRQDLQAVRQSLNDGDESIAARRSDIERALSNIERALSASMLFGPVRTGDPRLEEIRDELQAIRELLETAGSPSPKASSPSPEPGGGEG